jgi:hypothetical protein
VKRQTAKQTTGDKRTPRARGRILNLGTEFQAVYVAFFNDEAERNTSEYVSLQDSICYSYSEMLRELHRKSGDCDEECGAIQDCSLIYQSLKIAMDRMPSVAKYHGLISKAHEVLVASAEKAGAIRESEFFTYSSQFEPLPDVQGSQEAKPFEAFDYFARDIIASLWRAAGELGKLNLILSKAPRGPGRGRPPKYAKIFAILRLAAIYERFNVEGRKAGVATASFSRAQSEGRSYGGPFLRFVKAFFAAVDPKEDSQAQYGLGKTVQRILQRREQLAKCAERIHQNSKTGDLVAFMDACAEHMGPHGRP